MANLYHNNKKIKWNAVTGYAYHDNGKIAYNAITRQFFDSKGQIVSKSSFSMSCGTGISITIIPAIKISAYGRKINN